MNKKALSELRDKCYKRIEKWKKDNWFKPLDIELGGFIEQCRSVDDDIQNIYEEVWDGAPEDDPEVQRELWKVERHLFMLNLDDDCAEVPLSYEQKERIYFGKRIAMLRAERRMTRQELADKAGIKCEHLSRIEDGKYSVRLGHLHKIAKAFGTDIDFL